MSQYVESPTKTFTAGAAISQFLRVKLSAGVLAAAGVGDDDLGTIESASFASGDIRAVRLMSAQGTRKMVAAGAISAGARVFQAASGKIDDVGAGRCIGIALEAASANNDVIEVLTAGNLSNLDTLTASAAGATLTLTAADSGKTILLDTAAGSVVTLPAPSVGVFYRFLVSVKATSNFHQVKVAAATDFMAGSVSILDADSNAQTAYAADGAADDNIQLNGTTKGGLVGDWVELYCVSATQWAIRGQLVCPAGSNVADMFSAAV